MELFNIYCIPKRKIAYEIESSNALLRDSASRIIFCFKGGKNFDHAGSHSIRLHGPTVCEVVQRTNNNTE